MKELEISKKELEEKIAQTSAQSNQPFNEEQIYTYLLSFKNIDQNNEKAKQRLCLLIKLCYLKTILTFISMQVMTRKHT